MNIHFSVIKCVKVVERWVWSSVRALNGGFGALKAGWGIQLRVCSIETLGWGIELLVCGIETLGWHIETSFCGIEFGLAH